MKRTRHTTEQVIEKLRPADVALGKRQKVPEVCKQLDIAEQTYYRWRQKYGGRRPTAATRCCGKLRVRRQIIECVNMGATMINQLNDQPDDQGGRGELWPSQENQLIRMVVSRRWPIDEDVKREVVAATRRLLNHSNGRVVNGAVRNALAMER
jgi:hypothetical protein